MPGADTAIRLTRRRVPQGLGVGALALGAARARAAEVRLPLPSAPRDRRMTGAFPQKGQMILQRMRPPLLETPFEVFDQGMFTPNDRYPTGPHADAIDRNCLSRHSAGLMLTQPALGRADWQGKVTEMIKVYKAPVSPEDAAAVVDDLAQMKPGR